MMNPRVLDVVPRDGYLLEITFTSGEVGVYDCAPLLGRGVFRELQEVQYFLQARASEGTVVWPHEQDICPDTLYEDSVKFSARTATSPRPDAEPAVQLASAGGMPPRR